MTETVARDTQAEAVGYHNGPRANGILHAYRDEITVGALQRLRASAEVYTKAYDREKAADAGMDLLADAPKTNVTRIRRKGD